MCLVTLNAIGDYQNSCVMLLNLCNDNDNIILSVNFVHHKAKVNVKQVRNNSCETGEHMANIHLKWYNYFISC